MDIRDYQHAADETAVYPGRGSFGGLMYVTIGLNEEAGEFAGKIKKALRDNGGQLSEERREAAKGELGDVAWYWLQCCYELEVSPVEVLSSNIEKLRSRKARGTLQGEGDNR